MKRAAIYGGAGVLLVAYLAVANSAPQDRDAIPVRAAHRAGPSTEAIARDMQTEAARLRERLQQAPIPDSNPRNPFAFGTPRAPRPAPGLVHATVADTPDPTPAPAIPPLSLIGMAEDNTAKGVRRTAVLSGEGDAVYFVAEGDSLLGRYRVTKIGVDAIELQDELTHGVRRLAFR